MMTGHSIEELKRQYKQALDRTKNARAAEGEARKHLIDAEIAKLEQAMKDAGFNIGDKVKTTDRRGRIVIVGYAGVLQGYGIYPGIHFTKIKKDGTVGKSPAAVSAYTKISDLEKVE